MFNLFKNFFDFNAREITRLKAKVAAINQLENKARVLKDAEFPKETEKLKSHLKSEGESLEEILPWSFALVREAARRVLGERHFDVQLLAGVALHEGKIAEQKTGEGKTLSATLALYLNALSGQGVHLVTVNDYLARRDAGWMGQVFNFLGLATSAIISDKSYIYDPEYIDESAQDWRLVHLKPITRKEAYQADITYGINSEFGFDYLRDNMIARSFDLAQRGFNFAIIDEADSVLIDEARTPHIISAPYEEDTSKYYQYAKIVRQLDPKMDFVIDEKTRTAHLTESGIQKIEAILNVPNIYEKDYDTLFHIEAALKAAALFRIDKDYIVKDGEVIIVDEFTGRLLYGRRFSEGLHQAIEAKENVAIQKESKTLATVSLQNYFRMYKKLAGMTGTAATESEELNKIYHTDVLVIPTHRPMARKDDPDLIYKTEKAKFEAVAQEIAQNYKIGRPVLVGTTSIEKNELLSRILKQKGIPHELLNAKNHLKEAQIIARAGEKQAVTVATNMAGRGVDIILGGTPPNEYERKGDRGKGKEEDAKYKKARQMWQKNHDEVVALGGLNVIGTERHEARRIDNQLRGRSGRQGDPGVTRFFVSLQDDLMRIFGGEQIGRLMTFLNFPEDQPLTHPMVSKAIEQAQVKVEGYNFDIRKHLVQYDDVINKQREIIYSLRKKILVLPEKDKAQFRDTVLDVFHEEVTTLTNQFFALEKAPDTEVFQQFIKEINLIIPLEEKEIKKIMRTKDFEILVGFLDEEIEKEYAKREKQLGDVWVEIVRMIFLTTIDKYWTEHLTSIDDLREGINLRGYAQLDPLIEYKNEAYKMFERLVTDIDFEVTRRLFKIEIQSAQASSQSEEKNKSHDLVYKSASGIDSFDQAAKQKQQQTVVASPQEADQAFELKITPPGVTKKKFGRNDPCWCGSGKKFKKCHYPNLG